MTRTATWHMVKSFGEDLLFVGKHLEQVGDLAVNIAGAVLYRIEGAAIGPARARRAGPQSGDEGDGAVGAR